MNWRLKAACLTTLSSVPFGKRLYHAAQRALGTNRLPGKEGVARSLEIVELAATCGIAIEGATCVEVGTGWRPYLPCVLQLLGAKRTYTLDIHPWLTQPYLEETLRAIEPLLPEIAKRCQADEAELNDRFRRMAAPAENLAAALAKLGIEYRYPGDATNTQLESGSIDIVCSSNVLEHVEPQVLAAIHGESRRILRRGGGALHRFNPADHSSHADRSVTSVNFLAYDDDAWRWLGGGSLGYHNRLRCKEHAALMEQAGLEIVHERVRIDSRALEALETRQLKIAQRFQGFSNEELAADYMWLAGRRS
jgi:SAM-dependent methyltransferase